MAASPVFGQNAKTNPPVPKTEKYDASKLKLDWHRDAEIPAANGVFPTEKAPFKTLAPLKKITAAQNHGLQISRDENGQPIFISGKTKGLSATGPVEKRVFEYLAALHGTLLNDAPEAEFSIKKIWTDELGMAHVRLQQMLGGVPVDGGELVAHAGSDGIFSSINGRHFATPRLAKTTPGIDAAQALDFSKKEIGGVKNLSADELRLTGGKQSNAELVIFFENNQPVLAWKITLYAHVLKRWEMMIDAQTGRVLSKFDHTCSIDGGRIAHENCGFHHDFNEKTVENSSNFEFLADGPTTSTGLDLLDVNRTFPTYEKTGKQYMINTKETMFDASAAAQSNFPTDPVSSIWGLDGKNTSPQNNNFTYENLTNTGLNWSGTNNKKAVSAHYNSITSYKYFQTKHGRNSIDGNGGNIISLINVAEDNGGSMENAFWNGEAMFYGNGGSTFKPLARGLDVGGHEMSHGVIEKTANLEYQGESGAMNESFADIFGAMIEGNNWKIGEDVMQAGASATNCLRDMANPNNGGQDITDDFWQPKHVNEKYTGSQDNGGVHINSGIPNHAYYLFATNAAVGKDKAEKVFYRALDAYLVKSSKFKDLRISVQTACKDLYPGTQVEAAAAAAFDAVGITGPAAGGGSTGNPPGGNYAIDLQANPGAEYMLITSDDFTKLDLIDANGAYIFNDYLYSDGLLSRPSVTDNGKEIVFVNTAKQIILITINWQNLTFTSDIIGSDPVWRNVAVSKDGLLVAATTDDITNTVLVFPPSGGNPKTFTLTNPTYSNTPTSTEEVQYCDVIEFDHSGQSLVYDAYNEIDNGTEKINWWDIGFVDVWKNSGNTFDDGKIEKLFSGLPENTSVNNPAFSKNSPYIVGFDYIDEFDNKNFVLGVNIQTGDNDAIYENNRLGWPSYSRLDSKVAFEAGTASSNFIATRPIEASKIKGNGSTTTVTNTANQVWPVYFANGTRSLMVATHQNFGAMEQLSVFPNPATDQAFVEISSKTSENGQLELLNGLGQTVSTTTVSLKIGENQLPLSVGNLPAGNYFVRISTGNRMAVGRLVKS